MDETSLGQTINPKIWQIIFIATIAIVFTSVWLETYIYLNAVIWMNDFVQANRWTIVVGVLVFSLLVGLCEKYLHAPNVIHGGFTDSMKGEGHEGNYKTFPGTLLSSFFSLFSGASVGPEGPLAFLIMEISAWIREKLTISKDTAFGFDVAALSSAYNGIIGSPLFTAVFATEFNVGKKDAFTFLVWNLIAGVIGFFIFHLLGLTSFAGFLIFPAIPEITFPYVLYAIVLGILGALVAMFMGVVMNGWGSQWKGHSRTKLSPVSFLPGLSLQVSAILFPS
jgi:H+/Cl- antiporter ClcA